MFKIGKANNILNRIYKLNDSWGEFDLEKSFGVECSKEAVMRLEKSLHFTFSDYKVDNLSSTKEGYTEFFDIKSLPLVVKHINFLIGVKSDLSKVSIEKLQTDIKKEASKPKRKVFVKEQERIMFDYILKNLDFAVRSEENNDKLTLKLKSSIIQEDLGLNNEDMEGFVNWFKIPSLINSLKLNTNEDLLEVEYLEYKHLMIMQNKYLRGREDQYLQDIRSFYKGKVKTLASKNQVFKKYINLLKISCYIAFNENKSYIDLDTNDLKVILELNDYESLENFLSSFEIKFHSTNIWCGFCSKISSNNVEVHINIDRLSQMFQESNNLTEIEEYIFGFIKEIRLNLFEENKKEMLSKF